MTANPSKYLLAIAIGGATAGLVDLAGAMLIYQTPPEVIARVIAGGVLGKDSAQGGAPAAALGAGLQVLIGMIYAAIWAAASTRAPVLLRRPILLGAPFGALVFFSMRYIVVPLSNAPHGPLHLTYKLALDFASNCLFGVIIALWARFILGPRMTPVVAPGARRSSHAIIG